MYALIHAFWFIAFLTATGWLYLNSELSFTTYTTLHLSKFDAIDHMLGAYLQNGAKQS